MIQPRVGYVYGLEGTFWRVIEANDEHRIVTLACSDLKGNILRPADTFEATWEYVNQAMQKVA